ncbi:MAG: hypothetical protein KDD62_07385, partial [Bdellovibrionales bacterium]|nr:hypothetical protein [Bdellovibrionales bacterium]
DEAMIKLVTSLVFTFQIVLGSLHAQSYTLIGELSQLRQTGADNSLKRQKRLFKIRRKNGKDILSTKSKLVNIHAHYSEPKAKSLANLTYTGRFRLSAEGGGLGVTFYSKYPTTDAYYRLRRYEGNSFHIAPHGTEITDGVIDTGVTPKHKRWYRFKILAQSLKDATRIRAKVWLDGRREPRKWQVDCKDSSETRLKAGAVGVWSMAAGTKLWSDLKVS